MNITSAVIELQDTQCLTALFQRELHFYILRKHFFFFFSITDTFENFTLNLLSSLLVDGPNSPFYKALIEANIGTDFSPDVG